MIEYNSITKRYEEKCFYCPPDNEYGYPTDYCYKCHDEGRIGVGLECDDKWWVNFLKWLVR